MTYRWNAGEGLGQLEQMSLFALIINYWCRTLYCPKQSPNDVVAILNVTPFFLLFFFLFFVYCSLFCKPCKYLPYKWHQRGAKDRKPWSWVLKLSSFFGRHMVGILGIRNPDAAGEPAAPKFVRQCAKLPSMVTAVWNPEKGTGLAKYRREQSCCRAFCAFSQ